jgi:hypothetical protein
MLGNLKCPSVSRHGTKPPPGPTQSFAIATPTPGRHQRRQRRVILFPKLGESLPCTWYRGEGVDVGRDKCGGFMRA